MIKINRNILFKAKKILSDTEYEIIENVVVVNGRHLKMICRNKNIRNIAKVLLTFFKYPPMLMFSASPLNKLTSSMSIFILSQIKDKPSFFYLSEINNEKWINIEYLHPLYESNKQSQIERIFLKEYIREKIENINIETLNKIIEG